MWCVIVNDYYKEVKSMKKVISLLCVASFLFISSYAVVADSSLNAYDKIYAVNFTDKGINTEYSSNVRPTENPELFVESKDIIGYAKVGEYLVYENMDFGETGATKFKAHVAAALGETHLLEIRLDGKEGQLEVTHTGGWDNWENQETEVEPISGTHDLYFVFTENVTNISWFEFEKAEVSTPATSNPQTGDAGVLIYVLLAVLCVAAIFITSGKSFFFERN